MSSNPFHLLAAAADVFLDLSVLIVIISHTQPNVDSTRIYTSIHCKCIKWRILLWILEDSLLLLVLDTEN